MTQQSISPKKDRKQLLRDEHEEHFYATWPNLVLAMSTEELERLYVDRLIDINASYPDTMLWLKTFVLQEIAIRERGARVRDDACRLAPV